MIVTGQRSTSGWSGHILYGDIICMYRLAWTVAEERHLSDYSSRWNAALAMASYLDSNQQIYSKRNVLELGAGGALPSIVTANNGASKVGSGNIKLSHN